MDFNAAYGWRLDGMTNNQKIMGTVTVSVKMLVSLCMLETVFTTSIPGSRDIDEPNLITHGNVTKSPGEIGGWLPGREYYPGTIAIQVCLLGNTLNERQNGRQFGVGVFKFIFVQLYYLDSNFAKICPQWPNYQ